MPAISPAAHRVVVVGAGFGGLFATRSLARERKLIEVILIDRTNHHLFQPLLYQVATGILSEGQIAPATRDVFQANRNVLVESLRVSFPAACGVNLYSRPKDAVMRSGQYPAPWGGEVYLAEVTGFDLKTRQVTAVHPGGRKVTVPYDSLIVAAGGGQSYFGHDEYAQWARGLKTLADARAQRARIFGALEMAELQDDRDARRAWLTFAVIGGGPTGVEIAGQIAELARRSLKNAFRRFESGEVRVLLFEGGPEILANFGDKLSQKAAHELERIGVEIHTRAIVSHVDADGVEIRGPDGTVQRFAAKTKIWAAGVAASPLATALAEAAGVDCDRAGRIRVQPDCSLLAYPEVFAVGDMMNRSGSHSPPLAASICTVVRRTL